MVESWLIISTQNVQSSPLDIQIYSKSYHKDIR